MCNPKHGEHNNMAFKEAVKRKLKARVAIDGPTGAGKTWSALKLARALVGKKGKIAVIDTEHKTASKYLGEAIDTFDVDEFESFEIPAYIKAIKAADGYDALVVDSLSHAWAGKGGALEKVDEAAAKIAATSRSGKQDNFGAWREITPMHNELVETLIRFPGHLIVTMRSKMAYEKGADGKIVKLGMQPIQRDGVEYEFDVVCDMDIKHNLIVNKTRCSALDHKMFKADKDGIGEALAKPLLKWLNEGAVPEVQTPAEKPVPEAVQQLVADPDPVAPTPEENIAKAAAELGGTVEKTERIGANKAKYLQEAIEKVSQAIEKATSKKDLKEAAEQVKKIEGLPEDERKKLLHTWKVKDKAVKA
jgi:hypothetical protein